MARSKAVSPWFCAVVWCLLTTCCHLYGDDDQWNFSGGGEWSDPDHWLSAALASEVPNGVGQTSVFGPSLPDQNATVNLDIAVILGALEVTTSSDVTIRGVNPLTFDQAASNGPASILLGSGGGNLTIDVETLFNDDVALTVVEPVSSLSFARSLGTVSTNMTKAGAGDVVFDGANLGWTGTLTINDGRAVFKRGPALFDGSTSANVVINGGTLETNGLIHGGNITLHEGSLTSTSSSTGVLGQIIASAGNTASVGAATDSILTLQGGSTGAGDLRFDADGTVLITGGAVAHQGAFAVDSGLIVVEAAATHGGGTTIDGGILAIQQAGSFVNTGNIAVNSGGGLFVTKAAGTDANIHSVDLNSVVLNGGSFAVGSNLDVAPFLNASTTHGVIGLRNVIHYDVGGLGVLNFDNLPGGENLSLAGFDGSSSVSAAVDLIPDSVTNTLRFGGGIGVLESFARLEVDATIRDYGGVATHVEHRISGETRLTASNTYTGETVITGGTLTITNPNALGTTDGGTRVESGGTLNLASSTTEAVTLNGGTLSGSGGHTLLSPLQVSGESSIVARSGTFNIADTISGSGPLTFSAFQSSTRLLINGDNDYTGETIISGSPGARVRAMTPSALGDTVAGTTVKSGTLELIGPTAEPLRLEGTGEAFIAPGYIGDVTLAGGTLTPYSDTVFTRPIVVESPGGALGGRDVTYATEVTGTGNVTVAGFSRTTFNSPLNHDGDLIVNGLAVLNTANGFTGQTMVKGGTVIVNDAQALGNSSSVITIDDQGGSASPGGSVTLNESVARDFDIRNGMLTVESDYGGTVTLREETFGGTAEIRGSGILTGEVRVLGGGRNIIRGGTFQGTISGDGPLTFSPTDIDGNDVDLNSGNSYTGLTQISHGDVNVNHVSGLGATTAGTIVGNGTLNINAASNELLLLDGPGEINLNAQQSRLPLTTIDSDGRININQAMTFDESVDVWDSRLNVNANTDINSLSLRGPRSEVVVAEGSALSIAGGEIEIVEGDLRGQVTGPGTIVKRGIYVSEIENLGDFSGNIVVDSGRLRLLRDADDAVATVQVGSTKHAAIEVVAGQVYRDAIDLNNATGIEFSGALRVDTLGSAMVELQGPIHLGDQGAVIGAVGNGVDQLRISGQVSGGDLVKRGENFNLELTNADNSYTGVTDIREGALGVTGAGRIGSSSAIVIGDQGSLRLFNAPGSTHDDRIGDDIAIISRGGDFSMSNSDSSLQSEVLGTLALESGHTQIKSFAGDWSEANSRLEFESLSRNPGTTVEFTSVPDAPIFLGQSPVLDDGIIGGWAISYDPNSLAREFATYGPNGIQPLAQFETDINAAGASDNVRIGNSATLLSDKNINSLRGTVDLGGFELNVESGGVIGTVTNGRLTAGGNSDAELFLYGSNEISADIVDNAGGGSVSLVVSDSRTFLSGNNSYSGSTTVVGRELTLMTENAMPEGGDVTIAGGKLIVDYTPSAPRAMDHLLITGGGELVNATVEHQGAFSFNSAELQSGRIKGVSLHGSGEIVKTTIGRLTIEGSNPDFTGLVRVEDGVLDVFSGTGLGTAAIQINGGVFRSFSSSEATVSNAIELAGGTLSLSGDQYTGPIMVSSASELSGVGVISGSISGNGDLAVEGSSRSLFPIRLNGDNTGYAGNITINSGALRVGDNSSLGSGGVTINPGGRLVVGGDTLSNDITVNSGELFSARDPLATLTGRVSFSGNAFVGGDTGMEFTGGIALSDATRLTKVGEGDITFSGPIEISGESTFVVPQGLATMTGDLVPQTPDAVFNIVGRGFEQLDLSIFVPEGSTLTVTQYACADCVETLTLNSEGQLVRGSGVLENGVNVQNGAAIAPGESAGILTLGGDTIIGEEGILMVEIGGVVAGEQYDALHVGGDVVLAGILDVTLIDGFSLSADDSFVIVRGASISGQFANAADSINVEGYELPVHYLKDRVVLGRSTAVPEPGSSAVAILVSGGLLGRRRRVCRKPMTANA